MINFCPPGTRSRPGRRWKTCCKASGP